MYGCMESSPAPLRASVIVQRERVQASQARSWRKRVGWLSLCRRQEATATAAAAAAAAAAALLEGLWTRVFALGCTSTDAALRGPSARFLPYITALF